ncbi:MAG: hypothetical protein NT062_12330, partial [Proteobacteria bacterium]|nr:hypothetical protein [Pseudomonadota bacterium]
MRLARLVVLLALVSSVAGATPFAHERPDFRLEVPAGLVSSTAASEPRLTAVQAWTKPASATASATTLTLYQARAELSDKLPLELTLSMASQGKMYWNKVLIHVISNSELSEAPTRYSMT